MGLRTRLKPGKTIIDSSRSSQSEDPLLVAALAAVLVEYRRSLSQQDEHKSRDNTQSNWRMVARMSRLQRLP